MKISLAVGFLWDEFNFFTKECYVHNLILYIIGCAHKPLYAYKNGFLTAFLSRFENIPPPPAEVNLTDGIQYSWWIV